MSGENTNVPWVAFNYDDFMRDVALQSNAVIGGYMRYLAAYTKQGCKGLPNDTVQLRRISACGCDQEWNEIFVKVFGGDDSCAGYFKLCDDGLFHQKRAVAEFEISKTKIETVRAQ